MIGERLEEARKRKGLSIREAAEATKIRGDFLVAMENNRFDIPLPQIYIRGFLKNYARFLKLDPSKILTDYDAHLLGRQPAAAAARPPRESLGHIELKESAREGEGHVVVTEAPEDTGPDPELRFSLDREAPAQAAPPPPTLEREAMRHDPESWNENKTLYMKIGMVFAGIVVVAILVIILVQLMGGKGDRRSAEMAGQAPAPARTTEVIPAQPRRDTLQISASDNVTLIIEQTLDRKRLFSGSLNAGESLSLEKEGPVSIRFTNGSALVIQRNGQQLRPAQSGVGRTVVD